MTRPRLLLNARRREAVADTPPPTRTVAWSNAVSVTTGAETSTATTLPTNANLIFLANAPYNVVANSITSATANTAAIKQAYADWSSDSITNRFAFRTLVLPAGTIYANDHIGSPGNAVRLMGAGQTQTILQLTNGATGFGNAGSPKIFLQPGIEASFPGDNAAYANYITDMTIDVGDNNPGAIGARFAGCNTACYERITIRGGTGANNSGLRGLIFETSPGPALVMDVTIEGFDQGIWADSLSVNNMIFSNITLRDCRTVGIRNVGKVLQFEGLTATGCPKVYEGTGHQAVGQFLDVTAPGPGSGTAFTAVSGSYLYVRNATGCTGWSNLITHSGTTRFTSKTGITEWGSLPYLRGNGTVSWTETGSIVTPNLPHPKAPRSPSRPLTDWVRVDVSTPTNIGPALQAAIDSGKKVVYVPWGAYTISTPVIVRGAVERVDFMGSRITRSGTGKISFASVTGGFVVCQNISSNMIFEQNGPSTVVLRHGGPNGNIAGQVTTGANATGAFHCENFAAGHAYHITKAIDFFIRGSNREGQGATLSGGCTAWIFGDNVESHDDRGDPFMTISGSTVELLGGVWDNLAMLGRFNATTGPAMVSVTNSTVAILYPGVYRNPAVTGHWLQETRGGAVVGNVTSADVSVGTAVGEWKRVVMPLYLSAP